MSNRSWPIRVRFFEVTYLCATLVRKNLYSLRDYILYRGFDLTLAATLCSVQNQCFLLIGGKVYTIYGSVTVTAIQKCV